MNTLPFGAVASVHHFLRVGALLQDIGCRALLCRSSYFDDFPLVTHLMNEASTMSMAKSLLRLLGFSFAEDKLWPFQLLAEMLGVELDLSGAPEGQLRVRNKASRD